MRANYTLWRASNGWLLVPEGTGTAVNAKDVSECVVFKSLDEFAKFTPKRVRNRKTTKATVKGFPEPEPQHAGK